ADATQREGLALFAGDALFLFVLVFLPLLVAPALGDLGDEKALLAHEGLRFGFGLRLDGVLDLGPRRLIHRLVLVDWHLAWLLNPRKGGPLVRGRSSVVSCQLFSGFSSPLSPKGRGEKRIAAKHGYSTSSMMVSRTTSSIVVTPSKISLRPA